MNADVAFDTNVLLYLFANDVRKADCAARLVQDGGVIGVQVLNELANVMRRKWQLPWAEVDAFRAVIEPVCIVRPLTLAVHRLGLELARRYSLGIYDAMIVACACDAGCRILYSEDMQHGFVHDGLRIVNPFLDI